MDTKRQLGLRIKAYRQHAKLTQHELAARMHKSEDAVSNIERGKSFPSFEMIDLLCRVLNIPLKDLFDFDATPVSARHSKLLEELTGIARALPTDDLSLAVAQLKAIRDRHS